MLTTDEPTYGRFVRQAGGPNANAVRFVAFFETSQGEVQYEGLPFEFLSPDAITKIRGKFIAKAALQAR